jgi:hypothetical protein
MNETQQPESSAAAPISGTGLSGQDPSRESISRRSLAGVAAVVQAVGQSTTSKIRVCVAPAQAQFGQGNSVQADYGTPVRNALVLMMSGPVLDIRALDASAAIQMDEEAHQKQCDYVLSSAVTVMRGGSADLGRLMKAGRMAPSLTPMGMMAYSVGGMIAAQSASTAVQSAMVTTMQQQALSQLSGFNGQIKSSDEVTVEYQLVAMAQSHAKLENVLTDQSTKDGEDVLSPLLREAANRVVNEVVRARK